MRLQVSFQAQSRGVSQPQGVSEDFWQQKS